MATTDSLLRCSFCGKSQKQVKKLIAGPGVYICDECVDLCNEIIVEEGKPPAVESMPLSEDKSSVPSVTAPHLVGVAEIADILEVSRQRVAQLVASYEDFPRPEAELASGRVWSRSAVETWVAAHPDRRPGRAAKPEIEFADRLAKDTVQVLEAATSTAREAGTLVEPEHVLLGLFAPPDGRAARALSASNVTYDAVGEALGQVARRGSESPEGQPELSPGTRRLLELAALSAFALGEPEIDSGHLLIAICRERDGVAARVLASVKPDLRALVQRVTATRREGAPAGGLDAKPAAVADLGAIVANLSGVVQNLASEIERMRSDAPPAQSPPPAPAVPLAPPAPAAPPAPNAPPA